MLPIINKVQSGLNAINQGYAFSLLPNKLCHISENIIHAIVIF